MNHNVKEICKKWININVLETIEDTDLNPCDDHVNDDLCTLEPKDTFSFIEKCLWFWLVKWHTK